MNMMTLDALPIDIILQLKLYWITTVPRPTTQHHRLVAIGYLKFSVKDVEMPFIDLTNF